MENINISTLIKSLRKEKGLTQKELASFLNTTDKNIWAYENNYAIPPLDIIMNLSKFFNVSVDYLLGLEDDFGVKQFTGNADTVSPEEFLLLKKFRALKLSTQEAFRIQINAMYEKEAKGEKV